MRPTAPGVKLTYDVYLAPFDVVFSEFDVVEPGLLFISKERAGEIVGPDARAGHA